MTKYILHGGVTTRETEKNSKYFREITDSLMNGDKLLLVCYAKDEERWEEVLENTKKTFFKADPEKSLNITLAKKETGKFIEQIKEVDAVYMCGGGTHILKKYLEKIPNLEKLWKNKLIVGTSAGALVLGKHFYENDDDTYAVGLGILPNKIICH